MDGFTLSGPAKLGIWLLVAWALSERAAQMLGLAQPTSPEREKPTLALLQATFLGAVLYALADAAILHWTLAPRSWTLWLWVGASLAAAGIAFRVVARLNLGREFSGHVQTTPGHRLVTTGVYGWVRHPLYLGYVGLLIGLPLSFGSLGALAIAICLGLPALALRIRVEEKSLARWFGPEYREYQQRTKRMIPGVW